MDNADKQMVTMEIDVGTVKMILALLQRSDPMSFYSVRLQEQFGKVIGAVGAGKPPAPGQPAKLEIVEKEPEAKK